MADNIGNLAVQLSLDAVAFSQGLDASAAKFKQFEAEGRRVALDVQTPDEKYATEIGRLQQLLAGGAISQTTFARATAQAKMELDAATVSTGLLSGAMEGLEAAASVAAAAVAAVAIPFVAVGAGLYWAKGGIDDLAELGRESAKLGIETEKLSALQFAAGRSGGTMTTSLEHLNRSLAEAASGSKEARDKFAKFGLDGKALANMGLEGALLAIADRFHDVANGAFRAQLSEELMGRGAGELIPLLAKGAAGIRELEASGGKLGAIFSDDDVAKAAMAQRSLDDIGRTFKGIQESVGVGIAPYITAAANATLEWVKTLDIKAAIGKGFEWIEAEIPVAIDALGYLVKQVGRVAEEFARLGLKANAVFFQLAHPTKLTLANDLAIADYIIDQQIKRGDSAVDAVGEILKDKIKGALAAAKGEADKIGASGADAGGLSGAGLLDFTAGESVKRALDLPVSGLNIFEQYTNKIDNLRKVFGPLADQSRLFRNAVADLDVELRKSAAGKLAEAINAAKSPIDHLVARIQELKLSGASPELLSLTAGKEFKALEKSDFQVQHAPGAALQDSTEAYSATVDFNRQEQFGGAAQNVQERIEQILKEQKTLQERQARAGEAVQAALEKLRVGKIGG